MAEGPEFRIVAASAVGDGAVMILHRPPLRVAARGADGAGTEHEAWVEFARRDGGEVEVFRLPGVAVDRVAPGGRVRFLDPVPEAGMPVVLNGGGLRH